MKRTISLFGLILAAVLGMGASETSCGGPPSSDQVQRQQQETILKEATAQTGMPAVKNFRERKMMKEIIELRDQDGLVTYTYTFSEMTGNYKFFCDSIGYGLPYATQYTNPEKIVEKGADGVTTMPQADPNGLFSPASAEGTWVLCKNPNGNEVRPLYVEPRVIVSPFKLNVQ
ncbi:MAG: hypothetical protein Q7S43_04735 [bacterium]|nr:hypothetical protein [bacterium]